MDIEEKFKLTFDERGIVTALFNQELVLENKITKEKIFIKPKFKTYSILNTEKHFQEIAIVANEIGDDFKTIPLIVENVVKSINKGKTDSGGSIILRGNEFHSSDLPFNKVVYIFANKINKSNQALVNWFRAKDIRLKIRDNDFFIKEYEERKPDIFICHDSRDKKEIAAPIYHALLKKDLKIWYDEVSLEIGDSLSEKIQEGIKECRFGLIILTPNLLSNKKWAKGELQSFATKQAIEERKVVLPVWHKITESDLKYFQYWWLDKFAGNTNDINALAEKIFKIAKRK